MSHETQFDIEAPHTFDAPRNAVYRAFTDADQFARWYGPDGYPTPRDTVEVDPRVGGVIRFTMVSEADPTMRTGMTGRFTELVEDEVVACTQEWDGVPGQAGTWTNALRVELQDEGTGTRVVVREGPHPPGTADVGSQAWRMMFTKLAQVLVE